MEKSMTSFDVIVIGGGPGGYVAAIKSSLSGENTALIEEDSLGGVCLNWGCIPTKSLLRNAEIVGNLSKGEFFGFAVDNIRSDYAKAQVRSRQVSARLVEGIKHLMRKNKITVFNDTAKFTGIKQVSLVKTKQRLTAKNMIIATGSNPFWLPFLDYTEPNVLDSKKALQLTAAPKSMIIVGAGAVGMEFATIFSAYGTNVYIVEMQSSILPNEDQAVSDLIQNEYANKHIEIYTGTKITAVKNDGKTVVAKLEKDGKSFTLTSESILSATGISPNGRGLDLALCGVKTDERGFIPVNEHMQTSAESVYAIGDITGKLALAHVASAQGMLAVDNICKKSVKPIIYDNVPKCTYTGPEVASAGLTEQKAISLGYDVGAAVFPLLANGKAISYGETTGMVKLIYDKRYGQLLGAHMCGVHVTEMIWGIAGYLNMEMTIEEMQRVIHPHPSVSEAIMEAAHMANGEPIHI